MLAGFDFPLGLPLRYAEKAGVSNFLELLPELGRGEWARFYEVAERPEDVALRRPFYPRARFEGVSHRQLLDGLGLESIRDLLRECDLGHEGRRAATSIFWTFGPQQVGKATIHGWRDMVAPALREPGSPVSVWPCGGELGELLRPGRVVVAETYPTECYAHLGVSFGVRRMGEYWGKRSQAARVLNAPALLAWAQGAGVAVDPILRASIEEGFGRGLDGEDRFDSLVGLFGMLNVVLGLRAAGEPEHEQVRRVEGWMLGRAAPPSPLRLLPPVSRAPESEYARVPLVASGELLVAEERGAYDAGP